MVQEFGLSVRNQSDLSFAVNAGAQSLIDRYYTLGNRIHALEVLGFGDLILLSMEILACDEIMGLSGELDAFLINQTLNEAKLKYSDQHQITDYAFSRRNALRGSEEFKIARDLYEINEQLIYTKIYALVMYLISLGAEYLQVALQISQLFLEAGRASVDSEEYNDAKMAVYDLGITLAKQILLSRDPRLLEIIHENKN